MLPIVAPNKLASGVMSLEFVNVHGPSPRFPTGKQAPALLLLLENPRHNVRRSDEGERRVLQADRSGAELHVTVHHTPKPRG